MGNMTASETRLSLDTPIALVIDAMGKPKRAPRKPRVPKYRPESSPPARLPHGRVLKCASDVYLELADIRDADREHFVAFFLNCRHRVIARHVVSIGTATGCEAHPREVFKPALMAGATAMILAHNHPSGDPTPSRLDIEMTARLREVGEVCGIAILDHLVVAQGGFVSLSERGWK
jgi:DNA repair protein RadC